MSKNYKTINTNYLESIKNRNKKTFDIDWDIFKIENLTIAIHLFVTFFFISGFIYTYLLTFYLDIKISDFYTVYDYVESSIDSILGIIIWIALSMVYSSWQNNSVQSSGYQKRKNTLSIKEFIVSLFIVILYIATNQLLFLSITIFFMTILVGEYVLVKSSNITHFFIFLMMYIATINAFISIKVDDYRNPNYISDYQVMFKKNYQDYQDLKFLFSNSNYIFLSNHNNNIVILKKDLIIGMRQKISYESTIINPEDRISKVKSILKFLDINIIK